ncbi:predicted protein [Nematostella vectensis]|uniref:Serpin domain-containing protein n=1 Tax=Nematostella vectensis TaxID=45351 RepID=A7SKW8_NEMVE|nr:predicted protein [Nematostella vectensis]|eukprot:XP_001627732.1 predicted protein [Nematostella vectensis]
MASAVVHGSNDFALRILQSLSKSSASNVFFSPLSMSMALGLVYLGSRGTTAIQIANIFGWKESEFEETHRTFKQFHEALLTSDLGYGEIQLVNKIWGHDEFEILEEFLHGTREFYHSEMAQVDFVNKAFDARKEVNAWVHQQTKGNIKELIPHGVINSLTRLIIVNAVYFKGVWKKEFGEENTFHAAFFVPESHESKIEVEMMTRKMKVNFYYDADIKCRVVELPYSGDDTAMVIILPEEPSGIFSLEKSIDVEIMEKWRRLMINTTVEVSIPKFRLSQKLELRSLLQDLGVSDIFDSRKADLSGISAAKGLYVSSAIHKAHIEVNERGTVAAATTGVVMAKRSLDMNEVFYADHPFLFSIHHKPSSAILFLGKVMQPTRVGEKVSPHSDKPLSDEL